MRMLRSSKQVRSEAHGVATSRRDPAERAGAASRKAGASAGLSTQGHDGGNTPGSRIALSLLISFVTLGGLALLALGVMLWSDEPVWSLLALALLAGLAERFDLSLYGNGRLSVSFVPMLAAVLLGGLPGLLFVVPPSVTASALGSDRPIHKRLFNFGTLMLAGGSAP